MITKNYLVNRIIEREFPNNFADIWEKGTPANKRAHQLLRKKFTELFDMTDIMARADKLIKTNKK